MKKITIVIFAVLLIGFVKYLSWVLPAMKFSKPEYIGSLKQPVDDLSLYPNGQASGWGAPPRNPYSKTKMMALAQEQDCLGTDNWFNPFLFLPSFSTRNDLSDQGEITLVREGENIYISLSENGSEVYFKTGGAQMVSKNPTVVKKVASLIDRCEIWRKTQ